MSLTLFSCRGGRITLPDRHLVLVSREDGGNLCVVPPREVWERSELSPSELTAWSFLVAATGKAMLEVLPQLEGGCLNYWEAGNWALNDDAAPKGPKSAREYRRVHLHLLGRSRSAAHASWRWGEAPRFPDFANRTTWSASFERLTAAECRSIVVRTELQLTTYYATCGDDIEPWSTCRTCGYPTRIRRGDTAALCDECDRR